MEYHRRTCQMGGPHNFPTTQFLEWTATAYSNDEHRKSEHAPAPLWWHLSLAVSNLWSLPAILGLHHRDRCRTLDSHQRCLFLPHPRRPVPRLRELPQTTASDSCLLTNRCERRPRTTASVSLGLPRASSNVFGGRHTLPRHAESGLRILGKGLSQNAQINII